MFRITVILVAMIFPVVAFGATLEEELAPAARIEQAVVAAVKSGASDTPELRKTLKERLLRRGLVLREARLQGMDKRPEVKESMQAAEDEVVLRAWLADFKAAHPVGDADVQKAYDDAKSKVSGNEYHLRLLAVGTEAEAARMTAALERKAKFADLAMRHSLDTTSKAAGGDLGWVALTSLPEQVRAVVGGLAKSQYSTPILMGERYYLFLKEDARPTVFEPLDKMRERIVASLQDKALSEYLKGLLEKQRGTAQK